MRQKVASEADFHARPQKAGVYFGPKAMFLFFGSLAAFVALLGAICLWGTGHWRHPATRPAQSRQNGERLR